MSIQPDLLVVCESSNARHTNTSHSSMLSGDAFQSRLDFPTRLNCCGSL